MSELKEWAMDSFPEYEYFGVRTQEPVFELGPCDHRSRVWVDGYETDIVLNGLCATDLRSNIAALHLQENSPYYGDHTALIAGNSVEYGEDEGELIISDPVVVWILK